MAPLFAFPLPRLPLSARQVRDRLIGVVAAIRGGGNGQSGPANQLAAVITAAYGSVPGRAQQLRNLDITSIIHVGLAMSVPDIERLGDASFGVLLDEAPLIGAALPEGWQFRPTIREVMNGRWPQVSANDVDTFMSQYYAEYDPSAPVPTPAAPPTTTTPGAAVPTAPALALTLLAPRPGATTAPAPAPAAPVPAPAPIKPEDGGRSSRIKLEPAIPRDERILPAPLPAGWPHHQRRLNRAAAPSPTPPPLRGVKIEEDEDDPSYGPSLPHVPYHWAPSPSPAPAPAMLERHPSSGLRSPPQRLGVQSGVGRYLAMTREEREVKQEEEEEDQREQQRQQQQQQQQQRVGVQSGVAWYLAVMREEEDQRQQQRKQ